MEQVEKRLYKNNTAGYLGVVQLDHKGEQQGVNVDPLGTIWLSDAEAILTARAPKRAEDNPFVAQTFIFIDSETQQRQEGQMTPLVLAGDGSRYVPANDRFVPAHIDDQEGKRLAEAGARSTPPEHVHTEPAAVAAARHAAIVGAAAGPAISPTPAQAPPPAAGPASTGSPDPALTAPPVPAVRQEPAPAAPPMQTGLQGGPGPAQETEERKGWSVPPEAPGRVLSGALAGSDQPAPVDQAAAAPDPTAPTAHDQPGAAALGQPAHMPVGAMEEHAEAVDPRIGEETGRAAAPAQAQPEGEYAAREEIGSPGAPQAPPADEPLIGA